MNLPEYKILDQSSDVLNRYLYVHIELPETLDYFNGHFDDMLILPAVAQLDMVKRIATNQWKIGAGFTGLQRLKFKAPVWPNEPLMLRLEYVAEKHQLIFQYTVNESIKSQGTFLFCATS